MFRSLHILRISIFAALIAAIAACARQEAPPTEAATLALPQSVVTTQQVMLGITIPASDVVWGVATTPPADDVAWTRVRANAAAIAESAVLLLQPPRKADDGEWSKFSKAMYDAAILAGNAAAEKNAEKVSDAGNALYETCDGCHQKYMPARQGEGSAGS